MDYALIFKTFDTILDCCSIYYNLLQFITIYYNLLQFITIYCNLSVPNAVIQNELLQWGQRGGLYARS